jgi:hypothetical protein
MDATGGAAGKVEQANPGPPQSGERNAYPLNSITAKKGDDGSVIVQFGGYDGKTPNCLPTMPGWNYMVRFYRPRKEILDGTWKFPEPQPVK